MGNMLMVDAKAELHVTGSGVPGAPSVPASPSLSSWISFEVSPCPSKFHGKKTSSNVGIIYMK